MIWCCNPVCPCRVGLTPGEEDVACSSMGWVYPNYLWVDAICIDQSNSSERAQQVALMHEIYTKASSVIAWVSEEDEYTVPALRFIYGLSSQWDEKGDVALDAVRHLAHNYDFKPFWVALGHFFARPWWERIWIVQEFGLA
ncbi:heterokaryon incompatibility protein-domain-containing protein [Chaetomium strumarium]|uniref:Heterokaryon incompatibility protein-domain-containing protein n=1 Tax=Chaetomium strumarium TaxID=1170767 RepID=A0AAJ0M100_9PEZI|nr:heterokaryon incompatibility protein-domain-containing protein [Chaetomium strumarium]